MAILKPKGWYQNQNPLFGAPNALVPAASTPTPAPFSPSITAPVTTRPAPTPMLPISLDNPYAPSGGAGGATSDTSSPDWLSYLYSTQPQDATRGALGGLGNNSFPARYVDPESLEVKNDQGINQMFSKWTDGRLDNLRTIQSTDVNSEAAERGYLNFIQKYGYDDKSNASLPNSLSELKNRTPWIAAAKNGDVAQVGAQSYDLTNFIDTNRQNILGRISQDTAAINADIAAKQAAHQTMMTGRQQNQTAQQQAYNGMMGNGLLNGVLTPEYSMPGFGQVTGQAPVSMGTQTGSLTAGSGVFDPSSQTGVYGVATKARRGLF